MQPPTRSSTTSGPHSPHPTANVQTGNAACPQLEYHSEQSRCPSRSRRGATHARGRSESRPKRHPVALHHRRTVGRLTPDRAAHNPTSPRERTPLLIGTFDRSRHASQPTHNRGPERSGSRGSTGVMQQLDLTDDCLITRPQTVVGRRLTNATTARPVKADLWRSLGFRGRVCAWRYRVGLIVGCGHCERSVAGVVTESEPSCREFVTGRNQDWLNKPGRWSPCCILFLARAPIDRTCFRTLPSACTTSSS